MNDTIAGELRDTMRDLVRLFSTPLVINSVVPREDATVYRAINGTITGTTALTVWDPPVGTTFVLKGYLVDAIVDTAVAATAGPVACYFADSADTNRVVAPIGTFLDNAAEGVALSRDVPEMSSGRRGSSATANLVITTNATIGAGVIRFAGVVWGDEVPA